MTASTIHPGLSSDSRIARAPGTSLHRQLFVILRDQILRGLHPPGAAIPNEEALGEEFGVSRITVRRAVADLEAAGLLVKRHGRGTFVSSALPPARPSATLGLLDSLRKSATETQAEVLRIETAHPPADIARQLDLVAGTPAVHALRLRRRDGTPVMVTEAWVPEAVGRNITRRDLQKRALYEILISQGIRFGRIVQEITAVAASPFFASVGAAGWLGSNPQHQAAPYPSQSYFVVDGGRIACPPRGHTVVAGAGGPATRHVLCVAP